jgi:hypothetical protein
VIRIGEGEGALAQEKALESWVGNRITAVIYDLQSVSRHSGNLSKVGSDGIVLEPLTPTGEVAEQHSRFFPWSAIQSVLLQEDQL